MEPIWLIVAGAVLPALWVMFAYNQLVVLRQRVRNAWAQIDVQLKRRHDLVPNLVEVCKGYMRHERDVLEAVVRARQQAMESSGIQQRAQQENTLTRSLRQLFAVVEGYPELKASQNLLALQEELTSTENKVAFARQFYNDCVMDYNTKTEQFPSNVIAGMFGFKPQEMFEIEIASEREVPKVQV